MEIFKFETTTKSLDLNETLTRKTLYIKNISNISKIADVSKVRSAILCLDKCSLSYANTLWKISGPCGVDRLCQIESNIENPFFDQRWKDWYQY